MEQTHTRAARLGDAEELGALHVAAWQVAYRGLMPDDYLESLDAAARADGWRTMLSGAELVARVVVAEIDGAIAGFAMFGTSRDEDAALDTGELWAINVDPRSWRRGVGRALLGESTAHLHAHSFSVATLWVVEENERARRFYESAGWRADGTTKVDDTRGFAIHEMRYELHLE